MSDLFSFGTTVATQEAAVILFILVLFIIAAVGVLVVGYGLGRYAAGAMSLSRDLARTNREATIDTNQPIKLLTASFDRIGQNMQELLYEFRQANLLAAKAASDNRNNIIEAVESFQERENSWAKKRHAELLTPLKLVDDGIRRIEQHERSEAVMLENKLNQLTEYAKANNLMLNRLTMGQLNPAEQLQLGWTPPPNTEGGTQ
jgi:hypothetical protein